MQMAMKKHNINIKRFALLERNEDEKTKSLGNILRILSRILVEIDRFSY